MGFIVCIASNIAVIISTHIYRLNYDETLYPYVLLHLGMGFQWINFEVISVEANGTTVTNYNARNNWVCPAHLQNVCLQERRLGPAPAKVV
jgi:hypothetical protein